MPNTPTALMFRYKYLPFDEGSTKIISEGTIKFSSPLEFNDPFDCRPYLEPDSINELWETRPELYRSACQRAGLSPAQRIQERSKMTARLRREIESGNFERSLLQGVGVVCLSRTATNILMWSHYATFHRGFVVEFAIPTKGTRASIPDLISLLVPHPVHYSEQRPRIRLGEFHKEEDLQNSFLTKSSHWSYEEEERVIGYDRLPGISKYARDVVLRSVIAGINMSSSDYQRLCNIVERTNSEKGLNIGVYRAAEVAHEYQLIVPHHPRLSN